MNVVGKGSEAGGRAGTPLPLVLYIILRDAILGIQREQNGAG